jgi:3-oxoadipate enol-lactonase
MIKSIISGDCRVYYDFINNKGEFTVILIHGCGLNRKMWQPQMDILCNNYTVINIDVRGHGLSRPCNNFSIKEAARDLKNILSAEKCDQYILIGFSMGGYIIQEYAINYGGALGYMITGVPPIILPCYTKLEKFLLDYSACLMKLCPWSLLKKELAKRSNVNKKARKFAISIISEMKKDEFIRLWDGIEKCLHGNQINFDAPVLVACGQEDKMASMVKFLKEWKGKYENCETKLFKNASHAVNLDVPEEFNKTMLNFIESCIKYH